MRLFKTVVYLMQVIFNVFALLQGLNAYLLNTGCLLRRGDHYDCSGITFMENYF